MSAYFISMSVLDDRKKVGKLSFHVNAEADVNQVTTFAREMSRRIDTLLYGQVVAINLSIPLPLPSGLKTSPNPLADVAKKMTLSFASNIPGAAGTRLSLPAYNDTFSTPLARSQVRILDLLQDEPTALLNLIRAPFPQGFAYGVVDARGDFLGDYKGSRQTFIRTRR